MAMPLKKQEEKDLEAQKASGLRQLSKARELIMEVINKSFETMKRNYCEMLEENYNLYKKKESIDYELNLILRYFQKAYKDNIILLNQS